MTMNELLANRMAAGDDAACDVAHDLWAGQTDVGASHEPTGPNPIRLMIGGVPIHLDPYQADRLARQIDYALQDYTVCKLAADAEARDVEGF